MNRKSIRAGVGGELRYNPTSQVWIDDCNATINLEMLSLGEEEDWPFVIQYAEYPLYMDFEDTVTLTAGSMAGVPATTPDATWVGAFLVDSTGAEYEIGGQDGTNIYLTAPWTTGVGTVAEECWIRYRQYAMPRDCVRVLDQVLLQADNVMISPIDFVSQTDKGAYPWTRNVGGARPCVWMLMPTREVQPPVISVFAAAISAGVALTVQPYRYAYTVVEAGRESAPSLIVGPVTPTGGSPAVTLSGMVAPGSGSGISTGISRRIYREDNASGIFLLRATQSPPLSGVTTYVDQGSSISPTVRPRLSQEPTQRYLELRPYPGLDDYSVRMRYIRRLATLDAENDAPGWDSAFHDVLMWRVVVRMLSRPGFEAKDLAYATKRYEERYAAMRAALLGDRIRAQRRLFRASGGNNTGGGPPGSVPRFV